MTLIARHYKSINRVSGIDHLRSDLSICTMVLYFERVSHNKASGHRDLSEI